MLTYKWLRLDRVKIIGQAIFGMKKEGKRGDFEQTKLKFLIKMK